MVLTTQSMPSQAKIEDPISEVRLDHEGKGYLYVFTEEDIKKMKEEKEDAEKVIKKAEKDVILKKQKAEKQFKPIRRKVK